MYECLTVWKEDKIWLYSRLGDCRIRPGIQEPWSGQWTLVSGAEEGESDMKLDTRSRHWIARYWIQRYWIGRYWCWVLWSSSDWRQPQSGASGRDGERKQRKHSPQILIKSDLAPHSFCLLSSISGWKEQIRLKSFQLFTDPREILHCSNNYLTRALVRFKVQ